MKLLVIDLETTGLDPKVDHITELGYVLFDSETRRITQAVSSIAEIPDNVAISSDITWLTGITNELCSEIGMELHLGLRNLAALGKMADFWVAHNATGMEKPWLEHNFNQCELVMPEVKWIDTSVDVAYHPWISTRKLTHLAAEHHIPLRGAHGALEDCLTVIELLKKYDINEVARRSQEPSVELIAMVDIAHKDLAKERGFRFSKEPKPKWAKVVKQSEVDAEIAKCKFKVLPLPVKPTQQALL